MLGKLEIRQIESLREKIKEAASNKNDFLKSLDQNKLMKLKEIRKKIEETHSNFSNVTSTNFSPFAKK
ncbi:MAG: hypothetical protein J0H68_02770 [Sphingobacteriia bacterium]|nr:hypothetical protein [Sphingobacteriia bacterium]